MLFKRFKDQEKSHFGVCVITYNRTLFYYLHVLLIIFTIAIDICICTPKQSYEATIHDALTINKNFSSTHHNNRQVDETSKEHVDQSSLGMHRTSKLTNTQELKETFDSFKQGKSRSGQVTTHHSSHLGDLIQLLSQHSSEVLKNNNRSNKETINKHATILHTLGIVDSLKEDTNISDSYYDILYDLDVDMVPNDHEQIDKHSRDNTINCSIDHCDKTININEYHLDKK